MAERRDAGIDPRFDPAFQRGYDPSLHRSRTAQRPRVPEQATPPPVEEHREETRAETPAPAPAAPEADATPAPDDEPSARSIPYRLVLLIASIAAIAGAALLLWARITEDPLNRYYGSNQGLLFRDQFMDSLVAPLLIAGSTGLILWLAIGALRRRDDE